MALGTMARIAYSEPNAGISMATRAESDDRTKRQPLWRRLDRFLIRGGRIEVEEVDDGEESSEFKVKPGWTIKGL